MTRPPFGFGPPDGPEEPGEGGEDPFGLRAAFGGALGGGAPGQAGAGLGGLGSGEMFANLQRLMSWTGGPVNWDLAREVATGLASQDDPAVGPAQQREVADACRLADLWLDPMTTLPATAGEPQAWTRLGWIEATLASWRKLVDPVAGRVVSALGATMEQGLSSGALAEGLPPEMSGMLASMGGAEALKGVMDQVGGLVFGAQVGQALGALSTEVLGASEVGLPLGDGGRSSLLPTNVAAFGQGLEVPADEVRLYLALREAAHQRLFTSVPWLRAHLYDAVDAYARGIEVDPQALERAVGSFDLSDPSALQEALGAGMFELEPTEAQNSALGRLETALALVEGWVDAVVDAAATGPLPHAVALRETVRRRRASGGPAEQTFATLVGLQLRPRRLREAAALWAAVTEAQGIQGRDALWAHPDLLPGASDLDNPGAYAGTAEATDWDAGLRDLDADAAGEPDDEARGPADPDRPGDAGDAGDTPSGPGDPRA